MRHRLRLGSRLAEPMARHPLRFALVSLAVAALGLLGVLRFAVDSGESLLVGSGSDAAQTYAAFSRTFGSDPIVLVLAARNPTAPYIESNLERLGALEVDLAHDPRVASVLGPGTVAGSLREAAVAEVDKVITEYPYFVAETDYVEQLQKGNTNPTDLQQRTRTDISNATGLLELYVVQAASDAHNVRAKYTAPAGATVLDSREKAVDAAVAKDPAPPLWAEYLAGPGQTPNPTVAQQFFAQVASSYGDCDSQIASLLKISPSCQVFFERTLLDLPHCPPVSSQSFCTPKRQWAAVLPTPAPGGPSYEVVTIRLKPQYASNSDAVRAVRDRVNAELARGIGSDAYTRSLSATAAHTLRALGPLRPTECGGAAASQNPACASAFHDAPFATVMAGAPLLAVGVAGAMSGLLAILVPLALVAMLLILVGVFRVRGRVWPLVAAVAATVLTVGGCLLLGTAVTPAVLAGVPVLAGLGVDYAVQLVARFGEERAAGADPAAALHTVIASTAGATLAAAATTVAGLAALALISGVDAGPLAAIPLVAEFALVVCGGVVLAWLGGLFVALPMAVWTDARTGSAPEVGVGARGTPPAARRTLAIAASWRGVVSLATVLALFGWAMLRTVPVQTDAQQLLASSLPELGDIQTVQAETGYSNEVDLYIRGQVATGAVDAQTGTPTSVEWQCSVASQIRTDNPDTVGQATSIGDYVIATGSGASRGAAASCAPPAASSSSPSPSPSATGSPSAAATASPTALRRPGASGLAAPAELDAASVSASPSASASTGATASASPSASPSPSSSGGGKAAATQTRFLCDLRLFPALSRTLVMPIGTGTQPCPAVDEYQQIFLSTDATPIAPTQARIAVGVRSPSVAGQAALVNTLREEAAHPPAGLSAVPTGLAVLATTAYDNLVGRAYLLNLVPLAVVAVLLLALYREPRRALLPLLPTALAAGWAPLVLLLLGRLPGGVGSTLGSLNPLTVVLGALVIALGTEFGVVLLSRFHEELGRGLDAEAAAAAALAGVGRAIRVSALTLGAGFAVLAVSGILPNSLPLISDFGLVVVIDLALAVGAVFLVMLPLAVALEQRRPLAVAAPAAAAAVPARPRRTAPRAPRAPAPEAAAAASAPAPVPARADATPPRPRTRRPATPATQRKAAAARTRPAPKTAPAVAAGTRSRPGATGAAAGLVAAGLPVRRSLATFDAARAGIPQGELDGIASLAWVRDAANVCVVGPAGTGKTHLLVGIGEAAVTAGLRVRYLAAPDLLDSLAAAQARGAVAALVSELLENDLLLVDDLGFAVVDDRGGRLLLRLVNAAYEHRSLAVATTRPIAEWAAEIRGAGTGDSLANRLLQHATVLTTSGPPPRPRGSARRRTRG